ncbi:MAG: sensor domain-containing protein [Anaerolineales bacterium]
MAESSNPLARFFAVVIQGQTYLNLLYLLLALPLGLAYLIFFVTGLVLGLPLTLVLVGFLILVIVALGWWVFASFERLLAIWLLRIDIPPMAKPGPKPEGAWETFTNLLSNPVTWKSLIYLLLKPVLGIFAVVALIALGGVSLAMLISPLTFWWAPVEVDLIGQNVWVIDTIFEAGIAFVIGVFLAVASLHILNYLAYVYGLFARVMLSNRSPSLTDYTDEGLLEEAEHVALPYESKPEPEYPDASEAIPEPATEEDVVQISDQPLDSTPQLQESETSPQGMGDEDTAKGSD